MDKAALAEFYRQHLLEDLLPFWLNFALDEKRGGVFTCFDNSGKTLQSTDKYTWSQGRFVWLMARLAKLARAGLIPDNSERYLSIAKNCVRFLRQHAFLENGRVTYLLDAEGVPKRLNPDLPFASSMFADCFVILGFAEYAAISKDKALVDFTLEAYWPIAAQMKTGNAPSEPYPIPHGCTAHSFPMIMLNVSQTLGTCLRELEHDASTIVEKDSQVFLEQILGYIADDGSIVEVKCEHGADSLLNRHRNPGHALESMWFVMHEAIRLKRQDILDRCTRVIKRSFELGWDKDYGGLLRFVDRDGGRPQGQVSGNRMEQLILDTWDTKLWWPHSEALYTLLLAHELSGETSFLDLYQEMHSYVFTTFPNPDQTVGEWIQIRNRQGQTLNKVVALPVKDPFHIIRNTLLVLELLEKQH